MTYGRKKRGRQAKSITYNGETIQGLGCNPVKDKNGKVLFDRFYAIASKPRKWFGRDVVEAVRQFHIWQAEQAEEGETVFFRLPLPPPSQEEEDPDFEFDISDYETTIPEDAFWDRVKFELEHNPKLVAQKTGIEQVGYLDKLEKPELSISLNTLVKLYYERPDAPEKDKNETTNRGYWAEFCRKTKARTVSDLNADSIGRYGDTIIRKWKDKPPANIRNRFGIVRRILAYGLERGKDPKRLPEVLILCKSMLKLPKQSEPEPIPIEIKDFARLLGAADEKWTAILLLSLNLCMKPTAVVKTLKIDADLGKKYFSNARPKTGQKRVGILWQRTIDAIREYQTAEPHDSEFLFVNGGGTPFPDGSALTKAYRSLRKTAKLKAAVKFEHIRDGGYTWGDDGTDNIKLVAGHATGMKGRYSFRLAQKTKKVVKLIEDHYFPTDSEE